MSIDRWPIKYQLSSNSQFHNSERHIVHKSENDILPCIFYTFHLIWTKLSTGDIHKDLLSIYNFCENWLST